MFVIQLSPDGVLDEETIGNGLSNLGRSADGTVQVFLHLTIPVSYFLSVKYWISLNPAFNILAHLIRTIEKSSIPVSIIQHSALYNQWISNLI